MLLVVYLVRSLRTLRTLLCSRESKLPWKPWESFWMGWLTLTGEADTDITAGSQRAPHACWGEKKFNINHESQTLKYKRLTIKNQHGGDPGRHWMLVILHLHIYESKKMESSCWTLTKRGSTSWCPTHKSPVVIESTLRKPVELNPQQLFASSVQYNTFSWWK